jgi:uncharacterized protein YjbI with pentapeptide repeats
MTQWLRRGYAFVSLSVVCLAIALGIWGLLPASSAWADDFNQQTLIRSNFANRDLTDSSFTKANLRYSDFSHANLQGVSFFGANLESANLEGANLTNATLDTARLTEANLTNAILEGAYTFNTLFKGAIITGADFTDVEVRRDALTGLCKVAQGKNPITGRETRKTLNCE